MNIILVGAPGSGKGTQAKKLIDKYNFVQLSTGDILRDAIQKKTEIGNLVKDLMDQGKLIPDQIMVNLVEVFILQNVGKSVIFDGFPRTVAQANSLNSMLLSKNLKIDKIIYFKLDSQLLINRLTGRRNCPKCGEIYHIKTHPPINGITCEKCGGEVVQRVDDKEDVIKERLVQFEKNTGPTIEFYRQQGELVEIDGNLDPNLIFERIIKILELAN